MTMRARELKSFQQTLGHRFRRRERLVDALTHPSFRHELENDTDRDNQRLEFLGDAVIGLLTAEYLYALPVDLNEGDMTKFRSLVTNRAGLAGLGSAWNLGPLLRLGKGELRSGGAERDSNLADAVEAVVGAVFQDGGLKACRKLFAEHFAPRLEKFLEGEQRSVNQGNPKGFLQELTQRRWQEGPVYKIVEESGPAHSREYVAAVFWRGEELARGSGPGKRSAETEAARAALPALQRRIARTSASEGTSS